MGLRVGSNGSIQALLGLLGLKGFASGLKGFTISVNVFVLRLSLHVCVCLLSGTPGSDLLRSDVFEAHVGLRVQAWVSAAQRRSSSPDFLVLMACFCCGLSLF